MTEEEETFQTSNTSWIWICGKLIEDGDEKVGDYCHITAKFGGAAHWSCKLN